MEKYKLALVTPWIPQRTGIATYETLLVPYLEKYFAIDIFTSADGLESEKNFYVMCDIKNRANEYDLVIYEIGNNELFHKEIFELLENCSSNSVVELHDLVLVRLFLYSYGSSSDKFGAIVRRLYGDAAEQIIPIFIEGGNSLNVKERYPLGDRVARYAKHSIVHNQWCRNKVGPNCFQIPLAAFGHAFSETQLAKCIHFLDNKFGLNGKIVIGCFGWIGKYKRITAIIESANKIVKKKGNFKFVLWGEVPPKSRVAAMIAEANMDDVFTISGFLPKEDYWAALQRTDIVVNLRYPSAGESSATLLEEFSSGKPVIISNYAAYKEYPDDICIKIASGEDEVREQEELEQALIQLIQSSELREQLGKRAREYVRREHNPQKVARMYYEVACQIVGNKEERMPTRV